MASLGVINKGNTWDGMQLLAPYLPTSTGENSSGPYSEGGALYTLGLINSGWDKDMLGYLKDHIKDVSSKVVQHGAALGLGVAGMASRNAGRLTVSLCRCLFVDEVLSSLLDSYEELRT